MLRAALVPLLLLAGLAPTAGAAGCDATGQVCWSDDATGSCDAYGSGWSEVRGRNVMTGRPVVASWRTSYSCASTSRTDAWETNVTLGQDGLRTRWESQPGRDASSLRANLVGPLGTNTTTYWYGEGNDCTLWTLGHLAGAYVNDQRRCPAKPPAVPVFPWGNLLP